MMNTTTERLAGALRATLRDLQIAVDFKGHARNPGALLEAVPAAQAALAEFDAEAATAADGNAPTGALNQRLAEALHDAEGLLLDIRAEKLDGSEPAVGEALQKMRATLDAHEAGADQTSEEGEDGAEREALLSFLNKDWDNSLADDPNSTFDAMWKLLREGWVGYDHMTIEQLRSEADDAGYDDDEDEDEEEEEEEE